MKNKFIYSKILNRAKSSLFSRNINKTNSTFSNYSNYLNNFNSVNNNFFKHKIYKKDKLFSLLDINDKITNYKTNSLPFQYIRLKPEQIYSLYKTKINNDRSSLQNTTIRDKSSLFEKTFTQDKDPNKTAYSQKLMNDIIIPSKNATIEIQKSKLEEQKDNRPKTTTISSAKKTKKRIKDRLLPKGYEKYEEMVKDNKLFLKSLNETSKNSKVPKIINLKNGNSDIFNFKTPTIEKKISYDSLQSLMVKNNLYKSNVFNLKSKDIDITKFGEKYLFFNKKKGNFYTSKESNSYWEPSILKNTICTCSSKGYNILVPSLKNRNLSREEIYKNFKDKNIKYFNRQGIIAKYLNITNKNANNSISDYIKSYKQNPFCFRREKEYCCSYEDLYYYYKNLCNRPFMK